MRETDVLARLGGDELAVILPHADEDQARLVADKLVDTVRDHRAAFKGKGLGVTDEHRGGGHLDVRKARRRRS